LTALLAVGVVYWGLEAWREIAASVASTSDDGESSKTRRALHDDDAEGEAETARADDSDATPPVPQRTESATIGKIQVVDIGIEEPHLRAALAKQQQETKRAGQTLLVMLTGRRCAPCRGVETALGDARMQRALDKVRIVRVDLDVFRAEVEELKMPDDAYPAFFLLGDDVRPRDAIHGGEWDDDVAQNIAPVLGAFVRGEYTDRRHTWSPTTSGIQI